MKLDDYKSRALSLISDYYFNKNDDKTLKKFSSIYPFTTENIAGYFKQIDFNGKEVLTVCASGDHILNAILLGASNVDVFDVNPLTVFYLHLKMAAIEALSYEEYINFFCYKNYNLFLYPNFNSFSKTLFNKIEPFLRGDSKSFWTYLFSKEEGLAIRSSPLFSSDELHYKILSEANLYLEEANYYKLRDKIKDFPINFYQRNILDLPSINGKYDLIFLSNICCYLNLLYSENHLVNFKQTVLEISQMLKLDGLLYYGYLYSVETDDHFEHEPPIYDSYKRKIIFDGPEYRELYFKGINAIGNF
ncbi:MAG: DUF3419 family protein, partial [Bacilli bacterium]|nr:DUF3419 family protein [Bacilli bacterium]